MTKKLSFWDRNKDFIMSPCFVILCTIIGGVTFIIAASGNG